MKRILILLSLLALSGVKAEVFEITLPPETASFKLTNGVQMANGQCMTCHSADYITMQPPKGLDFWQAEVKKMIDKYCAPISTNLVDNLAVYFAKTYGTGVPAATPIVANLASSGVMDPSRWRKKAVVSIVTELTSNLSVPLTRMSRQNITTSPRPWTGSPAKLLMVVTASGG